MYYPKRKIIFMFIPMPMWMVLTIFLVLPLLQVLSGGSTNVAIETHLAGAGFAFLFKQFDLRWSRLVPGRLSHPQLRIFTPAPRETTRSRSSGPSRSTASVGGSPRPVGVGDS